MKWNKILTIALCFFSQIAQAKLPEFNHYSIFGDSLTDVGNYSTSSNNCVYFNAPITNHAKGNGGEFFDTTWANVGELKNILASNNGGSNYAVAGYTSAQILTAIKSYTSNHKANADTLYIIWSGTNDVLYAAGNQWSHDMVKQAIADGINNTTSGLDALYSSGARNFLIIGLLDLSKTPLASYPHNNSDLLLGLYPTKNDKSRLQNISTNWNSILFSKNHGLLYDFKKSHLDAHVYVWDPNPLLNDIIKNPTSYGYPKQQVFNATSNSAPDANYPVSQITYCGNTARNFDKNPDHYMFFNFIHPTSYTYHFIEQHLVKDSIEYK